MTFTMLSSRSGLVRTLVEGPFLLGKDVLRKVHVGFDSDVDGHVKPKEY